MNEMIEELRQKAKNFKIKKVVFTTIDIVDDIRYESEQTVEYLMSEPFEETVTINYSGMDERVFTKCRLSFSKDGKRIEWFNDKDSGVIETL